MSAYSASRSSYKSSNKRYAPFNSVYNNSTTSNQRYDRNTPIKFNKFNNSKFRIGKKKQKRKKSNGFGSALVTRNWSEAKLLPFKKDFYKQQPDTSSLTTKSIDTWKIEHDIECFTGCRNKNNSKNIPKPIMNFADTSFPPIIMKAIEKSGFATPTPIQSATWPMLLSGHNVIGIAKTGSGKTLAFLLPAIVHILAQPPIKRGDGPIAVIIAPTRELACQIEGEVAKFACNIRHCCVYGGAKKQNQEYKLRAGVSIIIATPGRLIDFLGSKVTNFERVTYTVIDEADRLLDMGFKPQLHAIMNQIRPDKQMLMFSATWPKEVRELANKYMGDDDSNVFQVAVGSMDKLVASQDVTQKIIFVNNKKQEREKTQELRNVIDEYMENDKDCKILVFVARKHQCNKMTKKLLIAGYRVTCIHGNKKQGARQRALSDFKNGKMNVMLATDVASRGIHVDDIKLVINFDFPRVIEDYVHRIGRTGRAGNKGTAVSFFGKENTANAKHLIKVLQNAKQEVPYQLRRR